MNPDTTSGRPRVPSEGSHRSQGAQSSANTQLTRHFAQRALSRACHAAMKVVDREGRGHACTS